MQQRLARAGVAHVERVAGLDDGLPARSSCSASSAIARVRTSAGMSPGLSAPSSECTSTPSQTSIATLARYSCERCIGLRVWNAAIRDQPSDVNSARVSAGVMNSAPYLSAKPPVDSTLDRAGEVHLALLHHHLDAGVLEVGGAEHRRALVRLVDRVLLGHRHRRQRFAGLRIDQRDRRCRSRSRRRRAVGGQRDGDRPEQAAGRLHAVADALPVGAGHESLERREAADAEHDDVALFARAHATPAASRRAASRRRALAFSSSGRNSPPPCGITSGIRVPRRAADRM